MVYLKTDAFLDLTSVSFAHSLGVVINLHLILLGVKRANWIKNVLLKIKSQYEMWHGLPSLLQ